MSDATAGGAGEFGGRRVAGMVAKRLAGRAVLAPLGPLGWAIGGALFAYDAYEIYKLYNESHSETENKETTDCTGDCSQTQPDIARQKQDGHIKGTPANKNRKKQGKPTSEFDGDQSESDAVTQEAWAKGNPVPGRPGVKDHEFGQQIGTGPNGGGQTKVRVHQDSSGRIHGHPAGPEKAIRPTPPPVPTS